MKLHPHHSLFAFIVFAFLCTGNLAFAASNKLEVAGWVPYWRVATGTADAIEHMEAFTEISPLLFEVKKDGTLIDHVRAASSSWATLFSAAKSKKVRVMPTITWSDGDAIDAVLRDPLKRKAHIAAIMNVVETYGADGIDIDYERKMAETKPFFTLFLKELYRSMGKKFVTCSIEARTPLESRFVKIPKDIAYANDFAALNKYCDRVRIMAYDQGSIDLELNKAGTGMYQPIADVAWVKKVVNLAAKEIAKKKIIIGIPTYGREYLVTPRGLTGYTYDTLWTFDRNYAHDVAHQYQATLVRNRAGELSFTYQPSSTSSLASELLTEQNTATMGTTTATGIASTTERSVHLLWWSDAVAFADKVKLARELGVRGVAIFKIDGGEDPAIWKFLP